LKFGSFVIYVIKIYCHPQVKEADEPELPILQGLL
jgi:hypothetical protein